LLALVALGEYLLAFPGQVIQYSPNPRGTVKAEVIVDNGFASAMDAGTLEVALKTGQNPFRHIVLSGTNYGAKIKVWWISDRVLFIQCEDCNQLQGPLILVRKWHETTICYGGSGRADLLQNRDPLCPPEY
jgi:hypothetical protein